jgi:aldose sugar dehydrogenase
VTTTSGRRLATRGFVLIALALGLLTFGGQRHASADPAEFRVQRFLNGKANDIVKPVDLAWAPGTKRLFFTTEDDGQIRIIQNGRLLSRPCKTLDVATDHDQGLTGIVLDPNFDENKRLYVYYTAPRGFEGGADPENKLVRFTVDRGLCEKRKVILDDLSVGPYHQGGQMAFDDEGYLFVTTGENDNRQLAQDLSSPMGKVLRLDPHGATLQDRIPDDNPFQGEDQNPFVWSYGHRNGFGLAYWKDGEDEYLYESENGPFCDDELNEIQKGRNYGWGPGYKCHSDPGGYTPIGTEPVDPVIYWEKTIAPTDVAWYEGRLEPLSGALFMGDYNGSHLHRFMPPIEGLEDDDDIYSFQNRPEMPGRSDRRVIGVSKGPGGWLYVVARHDIYRLMPGDSEEVGIENEDTFSPATAEVGVGGFVRWRRVDPNLDRNHNIMQSRMLFYSKATEERIDFTATFSAGRFPYECTIHGGMTGVVKVAPMLLGGPPGNPFTLRWATGDTDTGDTFDVDYKVDNGSWIHWKTNTSRFSAVFGKNGNPVTIQPGKDYSFRVRSSGEEGTSKWSPAVPQ